MQLPQFNNLQLPTPPQLPRVRLPQLPELPQLPGAAKQAAPPNYMSNYNDPLEINSMADIILTTFNPNMRRSNVWGKFGNAPLINIFTGTLEHSWSRYLKPISKGQGGTALMNALIDFGETMDAHFNPLKGFVFGLAEGGLEQAVKNVKMATQGDKYGRTNFDFDTGNKFLDFMSEVFLDPLNWLTLFGKGLIKTSATSKLKAMTRRTASQVTPLAKNVVTDKALKSLTKRAISGYLSGDFKTMQLAYEKVAEVMARRTGILTKVPKLPQEVAGAFAKLAMDSQDKMVFEILKSRQTWVTFAEKFERTQLKLALSGTGVVPTWWFSRKIYKGISEVAQFQKQRVERVLDTHKNYFGPLDLRQTDEIEEAIHSTWGLFEQYGGGPFEPQMLTELLQESVRKEKNMFSSLLRENWGKPDKMHDALTQHWAAMNTPDLETYITQLTQINDATGNQFNDLVKFYTDIQATLVEYWDGVRAKSDLTKFNTFQNALAKQHKRLTDNLGIVEQRKVSKTKTMAGVSKERLRTEVTPFKEALSHMLYTIRQHIKNKGGRIYTDFDYFQDVYSKDLQEMLEGVLTQMFNDKILEPAQNISGMTLGVLRKGLFPKKFDEVFTAYENAIQNAVMRFQNNAINPKYGAPARLRQRVMATYNREVELAAILKYDAADTVTGQNITEMQSLVGDLKNQVPQTHLHMAPLETMFDEAISVFRLDLEKATDILKSAEARYLHVAEVRSPISTNLDFTENWGKQSHELIAIVNKVVTEFNAEGTLQSIVTPEQVFKAQDKIAEMFGFTRDTFTPDAFYNWFSQYDVPSKNAISIPVNGKTVADAIFNFMAVDSTKLTDAKTLEFYRGAYTKLQSTLHYFAKSLPDPEKIVPTIIKDPRKSALDNIVDVLDKYATGKAARRTELVQKIELMEQTGAMGQQRQLKQLKTEYRQLLRQSGAEQLPQEFDNVISSVVRNYDDLDTLHAIRKYLQKPTDANRNLLSEMISYDAFQRIKFMQKHVVEADDIQQYFNTKLRDIILQDFNDRPFRYKEGVVDHKVMFTELGESIDELETLLDNVNPYKLVESQTMVMSEGKIHQLQQERAWTNLRLVTIEELPEAMAQIHYGTGELGSLVQSYAKFDPEALPDHRFLIQEAQELVAKVNRYQVFSDLLRGLDDASTLQTRDKVAFFSAIQNFGTADIHHFPELTDHVFSKIINSMDAYRYTSVMRESFSQSALYANDPLIKQKATELGFTQAMLHTAQGDVILAEAIASIRLPHLFEAGKRPVFFDIEAGSLLDSNGRMVGDILEAFWKTAGETPIGIMRQLNAQDIKTMDLKRGVLNVLSPGERYSDNIGGFAERFSKPQSFEGRPIVTERDLLENLNSFFSKFDSENNILAIHNAQGFDKPALIARLEANGLPTRFLENITIVDTLAELKIQAGVPTVSMQQRDQLYRVFKGYVTDLLQYGDGTLLTPVDGEMARLLVSLGQGLNDIAKGTDPELMAGANGLFRAGKSIIDELINVKATNKQLNWTMIADTWIKDPVTQKGKQQAMRIYHDAILNSGIYHRLGKDKEFATFDEFFADMFGIKKIGTRLESKRVWNPNTKKMVLRHQEVPIFDGYLSLSKMLFGGSSEGLSSVGFRNAIDFSRINEWTSIADRYAGKKKMDTKELIKIDLLARRLDKRYDRIKNKTPLLGLEDEVSDALKIILEYPGVVPLDSSVLKHLQFLLTEKVDLKSNWTMLEYTYQLYKKLSVVGTDINVGSKNVMNEAVARGLEEFKKRVSPEILTLLEDSSAIKKFPDNRLITIDDRISNALALRMTSNKFQEHQLVFSTLAEEYSSVGDMLFKDKAQVMANSLQPVTDLITSMKAVADLDPTEYTKMITKLEDITQELTQNELNYILTMDADTLFQTVVHHGPWIEFDITSNLKDATTLNNLKNLMNNKKQLNALGLDIDQEGTRVYINLLADKRLDAFKDETGVWHKTVDGFEVPVPRLQELDYDTVLKDLPPEVRKGLIETRASLHRLTDGASVGSFGDTLDLEKLESLYRQLPERIKKKMTPYETMVHPKFFQDVRLNYVNVGSMASRKARDSFTPNTIAGMYKNSAHVASQRAQTKLQYVEMYHSKMFSINKGWTADSANDTEILQALKHNREFVLTALVEDAQVGYKAIEIPVNSVADIARARKLDATIMPLETFVKTNSVINHHQWAFDEIKYWHRAMFTYKAGYLSTPGTAFRNWIDGTLKNIFETGEVGQVFRAQASAGGMMLKYNEIVDAVIKLDPNGVFRKGNLEKYFNPRYGFKQAMPLDLYKFVDGYVHGPSAGLAGTPWEDLFKGQQITDPELWDTAVHHMRKLFTMTQTVEQINRLSQYIVLAERGMPELKAFRELIKTHFDYTRKTKFERYAELVFPFYSFMTKNLEYFTNLVSEKPWAAHLFRDIMWHEWNFDDTDFEELKRNRSLQYHMLAGNIQLNDAGLTLKTMPSVMEALKVTFDPIGQLNNKLGAPFKNMPGIGSDAFMRAHGDNLPSAITGAVGVTPGSPAPSLTQSLANLTPIVGTAAQRYGMTGPRHADRTGSVLPRIEPSTFGSVFRFEDLGSRYASGRNYYNSSWRKYPPYARRTYVPNPRRNYPRFTYPNSYHRPQSKYDSFYKNHYTKKGASRLRQRMLPTTPQNLKYKIRLYHHYLK